MALNDNDKTAFVDVYTRVLVSAWSSDEYAERLQSDPRAALAEAGLSLPEGSTVEVVTNIGQDVLASDSEGGSLDKQIGLYEEGLRTGHFEFHIPATPQIDTSEMDLEELADIAAGDINWCCCCPCCCCG